MTSPSWLPALTSWAASTFPGQRLVVAAGPADGAWVLMRTLSGRVADLPLIVTPLASHRDWVNKAKDEQRSNHPVVAVLDGKARTVALVRWTDADTCRLAPAVPLSRSAVATAAAVTAVLHGRPRRRGHPSTKRPRP